MLLGLNIFYIKNQTESIIKESDKMFSEQKTENNIYIISFQGKLISYDEVEKLSSHFRKLRDQGAKRIILDMKNLDWMGSIGLGALVSCTTTIRNGGGDIYFANLNEKMKSILNLTQLDTVFTIYETTQQAVENIIAVKN